MSKRNGLAITVFLFIMWMNQCFQAGAWSCDVDHSPFDLIHRTKELPVNTHLFFMGSDEFSNDPSLVYLLDAANQKVPTRLKKIWTNPNRNVIWEVIPNESLQSGKVYKLIAEDSGAKLRGQADRQYIVKIEESGEPEVPGLIQIRSAKMVSQPYTLMGSDHSQFSSRAIHIKLKPKEELPGVVLFAIWFSKATKKFPVINPEKVKPRLYRVHHFGYSDVEIELGGPSLCEEGPEDSEEELFSKYKTPFYVSIAPIYRTGEMGPLIHALIHPKKIVKKKSIHIH